MVHTNKVNYVNSQEILMSPLDSSPDSDSVLVLTGLAVISLIGCEEFFNLRFVIERKFQHNIFFNNHTVFHG